MNIAKKIREWISPKKEKQIQLVWRGDWAYILKDGESIGHLSYYLTDEETKVKIINLLKLMEKKWNT